MCYYYTNVKGSKGRSPLFSFLLDAMIPRAPGVAAAVAAAQKKLTTRR